MGQSVSMKITSVTGHLMELEFAEPYGKKWAACQPVELFTAPLIRYVKEVMHFAQTQADEEIVRSAKMRLPQR